ncbi:MAG: co-chaperone GroES [Candidatus Harrisonbacteria bacterium CG10_big_fil_rev_8_21_14_0_10_49_15]|uniref:Co-chaperonin GroES n=1 Tax=Candidatus Harrisonbacteria bacterium CG10_big_fil_rev_8_21_14_0_10_49_15 TaxID=1974587 RepID=A0A2H0ULY3_9BACT|nr:MAG: co-chaperone GroES [Candidatus Harrisonbacteria bacterium CG10_big_fil_rev_8_21_14_0_10_49_15]
MNLQPLGNRVVIEAATQEKETKSGIVLPESADKERPRMGTIVAVGPGKWDDDGEKRVPMSVKVGDKVLFKKYGPDEVEVEGKEYLVGEEEDVLAVIS